MTLVFGRNRGEFKPPAGKGASLPPKQLRLLIFFRGPRTATPAIAPFVSTPSHATGETEIAINSERECG
jgi:hypothetical protein